ncbi:glycoside hydrolase family 78 protein [Paenibacillus sepulcri]|uniref:Glycoside hydrolase family 78 protein n=1 Tax=Paenibacillus sepulcri TaxID=359917 RepID=A0ABS7BWB4_9BACL|nr:glycoside hydrolase family 78 protein [Paenibacillus sepulcri]
MNDWFAGDAQWIWGGTEVSPRNEWRCFRKTFYTPPDAWDSGNLAITADSRYVLYVNGVKVGRGPMRSWPSEQSYDTYDIAHLLKPDQFNTLSVLVQHFGVSTFYYIRGRGGLLVQLDLSASGDGASERIVSDGSWRTARCLGQDSRASRMSCQHAFTERIDAGAWDDEWLLSDYEDSEWPYAAVIGKAGIEPWENLKPRDILPLTEETVYPVKVEAMNRVVPVSWTTNIDLRSQMIPGCEDNANEYMYAGYAATVIRVEAAGKATVGFPYAPPHFNGLIINGERYAKQEFIAFKSEKYLGIKLREGDNLLLIELAGKDHGRGLFMGIDCDSAFELHSPIVESATDFDISALIDNDSGSGTSSLADNSPFITIGPFECYEYIDHRYSQEDRSRQRTIDACGSSNEQVSAALDEQAARKVSAFRESGAAASADQLAQWKTWIRPVPDRLVSKESILALSVWKKGSFPEPVPAALQQVVAANSVPGVVPIYEHADTEIIVDFGTQAVGYISFELDADAGTVIDFYGFEHMRDGWIQHMNYLDNSLRYICRQGRQRFTSYVRRGFRYLAVTVRGAIKPVKLYGVQLQQSHYPVAEIGQFQCSDSLINDIWRISQTTTRLCMEDTFVDCPAYEQVFWVGDARNEALIAYYLFGSEEMVKRSLELVPGSKGQTPLYADQVPSGWNSVIPNWTFFWVIACREYYARTGDKAFAESVWPHVAFTLDRYLDLIDERGLLYMDGWNLLDWAPIDQPREGAVTHQNMFLVKALRNAAELAELAGAFQEALSYRAEAKALSEAINSYLWSEEHRAYMDCIHADGRKSDIISMQTQVVAYLCDIADHDRKSQLKSYLLSPPPHFVQIGSPFMSFFYYEALAGMGQFSPMLEDMRQQYGQMIEYGATTCWEMYPKQKDGRAIPTELTRSHCHAWSAAPAYFLGIGVLGVKEAAPGWSAVIIEPQPCGLSWARGSVPLPERGRIDVSWSLDAGGYMKLQVWLPYDVEAAVHLPHGYEGTVDIIRIGQPPESGSAQTV